MKKNTSAASKEREERQSLPVHVVLEYDAEDRSQYPWTASCREVPDCFSEGRSREEALKNIRDVLIAYFRMRAENLRDQDVEIVEFTP